MDQQLTIESETEMPRHRMSTDQGGFVLPWFALMLLVMIAMAGFGVDVWNWWYTAQKAQRAADAGALAGVVFMPSNFNNTARRPHRLHSWRLATTAIRVRRPPATTAIGPEAEPTQVTVSQTVNNSFTSLLGVNTTTISRSATAEFNEPVKMGSPQAHIANDPEHPPVDQHWLNIGAPGVDKHTGDRYADYQCASSYLCDDNSKNSQEYLGTSYVFTVEVPAGSPDIDIQAYDPEYANGGTTCDNGTGADSPLDEHHQLAAIHVCGAVR